MAYRIEYARSGRSACKGPQPCKGSKIEKETIRFGTVIDIQGTTSLAWRHWGCVTDRIVKHLQDKIGEAEDLDGYEDLKEEDQQRVTYAFENGHIPREDVTPVLVKETDEEGEGEVGSQKPKRKSKAEVDASPKKPAGKKKRGKTDEEQDDEVDGGENPEMKPKPKGLTKKRQSAKIIKSHEEIDTEENGDEEIPVAAPVKRKRGVNAEAESKVDKPTKKSGKGAGSAVHASSDTSASHVPTSSAKSGRARVKAEEVQAEEEVPKPKRGRSKKAAAKVAGDDTAPAQQTKTDRIHPPMNGTTASETVDPPAKKRRGRPKKEQ